MEDVNRVEDALESSVYTYHTIHILLTVDSSKPI